MFPRVCYGVLVVVFYGIPQEIGFDVFSVREVVAAFCRVSLVKADGFLLPFVVVVNEWEVEDIGV